MKIAALPDPVIEPVVRLALAEDFARAGDLTGEAIASHTDRVEAVLRARTGGVAAGYDAAKLALRLTDATLDWQELVPEGEKFPADTDLVRISGLARSVLAVERVCLNFVGALSGTASLTRRHVEAVAGTGVRITNTRKTLPGWRGLQIRAVRLGGGTSHRHGLDDALLIKDNHIALAGSVSEAVRRARAALGHLRMLEVEVDSLEQCAEALALRPDAILLDNMSVEDLRGAVALAKGQCVLEASGGIDLHNVREIAATGVDLISVGALTHSASALDVGLDFV